MGEFQVHTGQIREFTARLQTRDPEPRSGSNFHELVSQRKKPIYEYEPLSRKHFNIRHQILKPSKERM